MSLNIVSDPEPFSRRDLCQIATVLFILVGVTIAAAVNHAYLLGLLSGAIAAGCLYLFFCQLVIIYKTPPCGSKFQKEKDKQIDSVNKCLPFILIVCPAILCVLAIIIFLCYN